MPARQRRWALPHAVVRRKARYRWTARRRPCPMSPFAYRWVIGMGIWSAIHARRQTRAWAASLMDLENRIAVVSGGASGIGRELVLQLVEQGTHVAVCDVDRQRLEATVHRAACCKPGGPGERTRHRRHRRGRGRPASDGRRENTRQRCNPSALQQRRHRGWRLVRHRLARGVGSDLHTVLVRRLPLHTRLPADVDCLLRTVGLRVEPQVAAHKAARWPFTGQREGSGVPVRAAVTTWVMARTDSAAGRASSRRPS